jgi:hypothetical protein
MSIFFLEAVQDADGGDIPRRFEAPVGVEPAAKGIKELSLYAHLPTKKENPYQ